MAIKNFVISKARSPEEKKTLQLDKEEKGSLLLLTKEFYPTLFLRQCLLTYCESSN